MTWGNPPGEVESDESSNADLEERARNLILRKLARSAKSSHEVRQFLLEREIPAEIFEPIIERYSEVGLLDDRAFAIALANTRLRVKGLAKSSIRRELARRGVAEAHIEAALSSISSEDELREACALAERRFRQVAKLDSMTRHRRLSGFLARKGYSQAVISSAIRQAEASAVNLQS